MRIRAARVFTGEQMLADAVVLVAGERIVSVDVAGDGGVVDLDLGQVTLAPGLVDTHNHGGGGVAFTEDPLVAARLHRSHGTTTMIASTVTQSLADLREQVEMLASFVENGELAGIHLEGPWLAPEYKGAHPVERLRDPLPGEVAGILDAGRGTVRMVTIAAERPGAMESIELMASRGVMPALGHTNCDYEQAIEAIGAGVRGATHLFNAMPGLHHRRPGPVLALLNDDRVWCELIVDGVHLRPELAGWVMGAKQRVVLVTDAMAAAGCDDGSYVLGDLPVEVVDGIAHIAGTNTIAGSTLTLSRAVQVAIDAGVSPEVALRAATANPADYLGLEGVGRLLPGHWADLVVFDADWDVNRVMYRGSFLP